MRLVRPSPNRRTASAFVAVLALLVMPSAADAHEKWFFDPSAFPLRFDVFFSEGPVWWTLGTLVVVALLAVLWNKRGHRDFIPDPDRLGATPQSTRVVYALLPLIIGVHVAVPLFFNGTHGILFSPNIQLHGPAAYLCGIGEIYVALAFLYGGLTRLAAILLAALWLAGIPLAGLQAMLDNAMFLGIAAFFFMVGRGPISIDRFMFPRLEPPEALARHAVTALRVGIGASFVVVAFTEKLANLPYALAFLRHYPLNFTAFFHVPIPDTIFMSGAGAVELLIGLCLLFGIFAREIIILAWLPINVTLTYFNDVELIGHLPIYGIMALLLIWIPGEANRDQWIAGLRLFRAVPEGLRR